MSLTQRILIAMGLGIGLGAILQWLALPQDHIVMSGLLNGVIDGGGKIFVSLLKMLVVPLVFVSLVCGAASLGDSGAVGRLGGKTYWPLLVNHGLGGFSGHADCSDNRSRLEQRRPERRRGY
jgi:Na+/H+-dicarboxylate symporter